jgi:F-type H+-transporting ATPase subunit b
MPQFDPTLFSSQLFWLYVTFGVLLVVMWTIAMPKIGSVLDERQRKIDDNLDSAGELKAEAETAIANYEKALADSRAEARRVIKEAGDAQAARAGEAEKALGERLSQQVKAGEARIVAARDQAMAHVRELAADVAQVAVQHLAGVTIDSAKAAEAVASALKETR